MRLKMLLVLLILLSSVAGLAQPVQIENAEAGIGSWQEMPFGQMRILSCSSGVKDLSMIVGGLQVQLKPDWVMKKPTLKPLSDKYASWIEMPVPTGNGQNPTYKGEVLIPFIYSRSPSDTTDFDFGVQGDFPVCQGKRCMILPIRMQIKLSSLEADYTSACPYLIEKQKQTPLPAEILGIQGKAWLSDDEIQMVFSGLKEATVAFLQTTTELPFQVQETQMEKTGVILRVKTQPWTLGTAQNWILITDKGFFKVPVKMQQEAATLPPAPPSKTIWFLGWELFFLTPLFIWWGLGCARTNKIWKKDIVHFISCLPVVFILKGIINHYFPLDFIWYPIGLLGLVCLFPPVKKTTALGLLLLWPIFPKIPEISFGLMILWGLVMLIEISLPFLLLYMKTDEIGKVLRNFKKAHFFTFNLIFLLPTVFLMISFIERGMQRTVFSDTLNLNGFSVVGTIKDQSIWKQEAHFIDPNGILGESLKQMYHRSTVVIWQDKNGRLILTPDISKKKAMNAISNWQNYHAVNTP